MTKNNALSSSTAIIDWEACLLVVGGKIELAKMMLELFTTNLPVSLSSINQHFQENAWEKLAAELHKLLGGCCYAGSTRLKESVKAAEVAVRQNSDIARIGELIEQVNQDIKQVITFYQTNPQLQYNKEKFE